jgi:hypothetical protein
MSNDLKAEYIAILRGRYQKSSKKEKGRFLTELCENTGLSRKHGIRALNKKAIKKNKSPGRHKKYTEIAIQHLKKMWMLMQQMNSKKMVAALPHWLSFYECGDAVKQELLAMSHATIDRKLKAFRVSLDRRQRSGTRPGSLRHIIPIKPFDYNINEPGFVEADTVAHCGGSLAGDFIWSLTLTDIYSGWTENRGVWGKGASGVVDAVRSIETVLPFEIKAFNSDNGSEFLNYHLIRYFSPEGEKPRLKQLMTRSREYKKNDNAHVEQKNFTHVRELFGYDRFDKSELLDLVNDIYTNDHALLQNFFIPQVKLESKLRVGSRYKRKYTKPVTPYQRIINCPSIAQETKDKLTAYYKTLNPLLIQKSLQNKLNNFFKMLYKKSDKETICA